MAIATASILPAGPLPYYLYRGWTFYLQMLVIALELILTLVSTYDFVLSRRLGGDPTFYSRDPSGSGALTYSNPSFKDDAGRGVSAARPTNGSASITSLNSTVSSSSIRSSNGKHVPGSRLQLARQISAQKQSPSSGRTSPHRNRPCKCHYPLLFTLSDTDDIDSPYATFTRVPSKHSKENIVQHSISPELHFSPKCTTLEFAQQRESIYT